MTNFRVNSPELLDLACGAYLKGRLAVPVFGATVIEALRAGVDAKAVLIAAGVVPSSLPRYGSLVSAGFFDGVVR